MPISQIERFRVDDLTQYDNQKLRCVVSEIDRADQNVILSRRDLLDIEAAQEREKLVLYFYNRPAEKGARPSVRRA